MMDSEGKPHCALAHQLQWEKKFAADGAFVKNSTLDKQTGVETRGSVPPHFQSVSTRPEAQETHTS